MENQENNNLNQNDKLSNVPNVSVEETAKKVAKKREKNIKLYIALFSIIGIIGVLIALFIVFRHFFSLKQVTYDETYSLYQYFSGVKVSYPGKATLTNEGNITTIESGDVVENIHDAPIFFEDKGGEILIPKSMQLLIPRYFNKNYKLNYFTNIVYDETTDIIYYKKGKKNIYLEDSFLYDGDNLYLFLMDVELAVGEKEYKLNPLSYVIVNYGGQVEIYDKKNDKYEVIDECLTDVIATSDQYKINLSKDAFSYGETSRLLFKSVDSLKVYESDR